MVEQPKDRSTPEGPAPFGEGLEAKLARKVKARASGHSVWFGLGMMGLIGWSVTVPTLLGAALGIWLDKQHTDAHSWTLSLLIVGLAIGCLNAWHWVAKEDRFMHDDREGRDG